MTTDIRAPVSSVVTASQVRLLTLRRMVVAALFFLNACAGLREPPVDPVLAMEMAIKNLIATSGADAFEFPAGTELDTLRWDGRYLEIVFSEHLGRRPFRPSDVQRLTQLTRLRVQSFLGGRDLSIMSMGVPIAQLVPNAYRSNSIEIDESRIDPPQSRPAPLVSNVDRAYAAPNGLDGRNVALWPSHGWYYDNGSDVWKWQRLRMFQTVEDLLTLSFAVPYLTPMLENAGANVFLPRERDPQTSMVVVDNDSSSAMEGMLVLSGKWNRERPGFSVGQPPYPDGLNPFQTGTYLSAITAATTTASLAWLPNIRRTGEYAVYVSYANVANATETARYTVHHSGGETRFDVNQTIGGGTWVYLGTFRFDAGADSAHASVTLTNAGVVEGRRITADAVRFGGGIGLIARNGKTGGRPRFMEGARYHLQYSGMPDTLVYNLHSGQDDYRDDYQSRGEWVNYLRGAPFGPNRNRTERGLGIPIDISLAMHTDAGTRGIDSTIGTLAIYSIEGADSTSAFPNGVSRFANRDLADLVQTQLVGDIRFLHDSTFTRRSLLNAQYSEAFRPNVPALLLELLSHQNPEDALLGLDPRVRFDASRAIYKGLLKFLAFQNGYDYVVQPLPPDQFSATMDGQGVRLRWQPVVDPLEPTATPEGYVVYVRVGDGGWDNGTYSETPEFYITNVEPGRIYSFQVTAVNTGGQSFPSETLSVSRSREQETMALIINGFDRVAPPEFIHSDSVRGVAFFLDEGVPERVDFGFTGYQFNYNDRQIWRSDSAPYHGASHADFDTTAVVGNTFDFPRVHGSSLMASGFSFDSASDEAVAEGVVDLARYAVVDLILGEEKRTGHSRSDRQVEFEALPPALRERLQRYLARGGRLFVSGAHVASDLLNPSYDDAAAKTFADSVLHVSMVTTHASRRGAVYSIDATFGQPALRFSFNTTPSPDQYSVEAPDGLRPIGTGQALLRYSENNLVAGVGYRDRHRVVVFGFPFEVITTQQDRDSVMSRVLSYLFSE